MLREPHLEPTRPRLAAPSFAAAVAFIALALLWLVPGLIGRGAWKPDEGYSFGLVLSMLREGEWIVPTLAGEPFMEKPPLMYWLGAAGAWLLQPWLPIPEGMRLACVLCAVLAFWFVYLAARESDDADTAASAVWLLAGCPSWLIATRYLTCDVTLVTAQAIALYGLARIVHRGGAAGWGWFGTGVGIGVLSKGQVLLAANGFAFVLLVVLHPRFRRTLSVRTLGAAVLAALPWMVVWPALLFLVNPVEFRVWIWDNNIGRFFGLNSLGPQTGWHRTIDVTVFLLPVLPLALVAVWQRGWRDYAGVRGVAITLWAAWTIMLASSSQLAATYFLPAFAPLAVLAAGVRIQGRQARRAAFVGLILLIVAALVTVLVFKAGWIAAHRPGFGAAVTAAPLMPIVLAAAVIVPIGYLGYLLVIRRRSGVYGDVDASLPRLWAIGLTTIWALFVGLCLPWAERTLGFAAPITAVLAPLPADRAGCVASLGLGENERAIVHYHAGLKTIRFEVDRVAADRCAYLLVQREIGAGETIVVEPKGELLARTHRPRDPERDFSLYKRLR